MPNPPTQGREAIERGAKALAETVSVVENYVRGGLLWDRLSEDWREFYLDQARAVLTAAYPQQTEDVVAQSIVDKSQAFQAGREHERILAQQTEGDERGWEIRAGHDGALGVWEGPDLDPGESVDVVPKSSLTAAEQRADLAERKEAERIADVKELLSRAENDRADKDRLQRRAEDALRRAEAAEKHNRELKAYCDSQPYPDEVDRLQRECERLTTRLQELEAALKRLAYLPSDAELSEGLRAAQESE